MSINSIPGPPGLPILGNWIAHRRDLLGFLARCAREYGDVASFSLFNISCCLVTHPDLIRQVLVEDNAQVKKPWDVHELEVVLGQGLLTNEGDDWRHQRQLIQPAFRHDRVRDYGRIMVFGIVESVIGPSRHERANEGRHEMKVMRAMPVDPCRPLHGRGGTQRGNRNATT